MSITSDKTFTLRIETNGDIECVHTEDTKGLLDEGKPFLFRATDVEYNNETGKWDASVRSDGKQLTGFSERKDALVAEVDYLHEKLRKGSIHAEQFKQE